MVESQRHAMKLVYGAGTGFFVMGVQEELSQFNKHQHLLVLIVLCELVQVFEHFVRRHACHVRERQAVLDSLPVGNYNGLDAFEQHEAMMQCADGIIWLFELCRGKIICE